MGDKVYIYIFEDGDIVWSQRPPSEAEMIEIEDGHLQVIRYSGDQPMGVNNGRYLPIPEGVQVRGNNGNVFTVPKKDAVTLIDELRWAIA